MRFMAAPESLYRSGSTSCTARVKLSCGASREAQRVQALFRIMARLRAIWLPVATHEDGRDKPKHFKSLHCRERLEIIRELKKFNSLTNPNLIDEMDAAGQGHPGLAARLKYRTARLGPSMYMSSMLSRPKYPVKPPALDAGVAASQTAGA